MNATDLARRLGRDLWHALAGGPDEPPPLLRRAREAVTPLGLALVVILGLIGWWVALAPLTVALQPTAQGSWLLVVMTLSAGLLVLAAYRPLLAWRLAWLAMLYELTVAPLSRWSGLPFPPLFVSLLQLLILLVVLFVVAASQTRGVVFWVWLLTGLLAWAVPLNGSADFRLVVGRAVDGFAPFGYRDWYEWGEAGDAVLLQLYRVLGAVPAQLLAVGLITVVVLAGQLSRYRSQARQRLAVAEEHGLVLAERARIARELHDVIAHHMSMIAVRAETAPYRLRTEPELPEPARAEFQQISHESRTALTEMRRLLGVLRSDEPAPPTTPQPGLTDLGDLVESARAAGATVTLEMHGAMTGLPAAVDVTGYRIVQEALTNAARHAVGAPVRITLRRTDVELSLSVRNQAGPPAPPGGAPGHGLRGMRERAAALGGELRAGPTEDGGFEVSVTLPLAGVRS